MTDIIPATNGHKTGRKKALTELEALTAVTAANDQLKAAQNAYEKAVAALAGAKQAHDTAKATADRASDDLEAAEQAAADARKALRNVKGA